MSFQAKPVWLFVKEMSKPNSNLFPASPGALSDTINSLPANPNELLSRGWEEVTSDEMKENSNSRQFENSDGLKARFDKGEEGANGFKGKDHYHVSNPNATGKKDAYLDKNGKPVPKNSKASHIIPKEKKKK